MLEKKVLRRIFRSKRDEVAGVWRKLLNVELLTCTLLQVSYFLRGTTWIMLMVADQLSRHDFTERVYLDISYVHVLKKK